MGLINQAAATCLGNIHLVEDVDGLAAVSLGASMLFGHLLARSRKDG